MSENIGQVERPAGLIDRAGEALTRVCLAIAAISLLSIVAINGANVIGRYFFGRPFSWAEELMLYLMILGVFSGGIAVTWRNMHIRIDTVVERTSPPVQRVARVLAVPSRSPSSPPSCGRAMASWRCCYPSTSAATRSTRRCGFRRASSPSASP